MKSFKSVRSFIEESQIRKHKVFVLENDMDRDPKLASLAYTDLIGNKILIDDVEREVLSVRDYRKGHGEMYYKKGELIGVEVKH